MSTPRSATSPQAYDNYLKRPQAATIGSGQQIRVSEVVCLQTYEITEVLSKSGGPSTIIPTGSSLGFRNAEDRYLKYALVLRRVVKESLEHVETVLEINSEYINEYLKTCHSDYPGINLSAQPVLIPEPYEILFHHRTAIRNYTSSAAKGLEKQHMEVLVDFISKNLRDVERAYEQNRRGERPKTSFEDLWTIFPPRSVVVTLGDIIECSRVMETAYEVKDNTPTFTIRSWHWDYHDGLFGPSETDLALTSFKGVCDVSSLRMCPLEDAIGDPRTGVKKADIQARGNTWRDIVKSKHLEYHHGPAWVSPRTAGFVDPEDLVVINTFGRVMVDYESHRKANYKLATELMVKIVDTGESQAGPLDTSGSSNPRVAHSETVACRKDEDSYKIDPEMALLTPARVRGYSLRSKQWGFFLVTNLQEIKWHPEYYDSLQMNPTLKEVILALAEKKVEVYDEDSIHIKGSGGILLLHGPPGSGKTLTAESIAEKTKSPLLYISSGDLGIHPDQAETRLKDFLDLATCWNAILLLDEADVFLAKRGPGNIVRNAFVSIFLRHLEYFQGVMFLTTNRVHAVDAAFQSRVHLSIEYPGLSEADRTAIWKTHLLACKSRNATLPEAQRIDTTNVCKDDTYRNLGHDFDINGRDINNRIRVAEAVARHRNKILTVELLREISLFDKPLPQDPETGLWSQEDDSVKESDADLATAIGPSTLGVEDIRRYFLKRDQRDFEDMRRLRRERRQTHFPS